MNIKKIIKTAAALLMTAAIFTGCNNGLVDDYTAEQNTEGKAVVTFGLKDSSARTVNPAYTVSNLTDIKISYKKAGDAEETVIVSGKKYSGLTGGKYSAELKVGTYNFYATAKAANINLSATVENKAIVEGTNSVSFSLAKSSAGTASGTGFIDISFTVTDTDVKAVKGTLYNYSNDSEKIATKTLALDSVNNTFAYKVGEGSAIATSIAGGNYRLVLDFYADAAATLKLGTYRELINVSDGLTSSAERTIGEVENVYSITVNLNGGTLAGGVTIPETVTRFSDAITLPGEAQMSKDDALFRGWYTSADFIGSAVTSLSGFTGNVSLYAKWGEYLTFKGDGEFSLGINADEGGVKGWDGTVEYSTDKTVWTEWDGSTEIPAVAADGSYYVYLRGKGNTSFYKAETYQSTIISLSGTADSVECDGNIMTLLDWENPKEAELGSYCFYNLFNNCKKLTKAPSLPAKKLSVCGYSYMFFNCSSLASAPELPATELDEYCYQWMFFNCTSLVSAPELKAENMAESCYEFMFAYCKALEETPELPATTLAGNCYSAMFTGCSSLSKIGKISATNIDKDYAMYNMFYNCSRLKVVETTDLKAAVLTLESVSGLESVGDMFEGCRDGSVVTPEAGKSYTYYPVPKITGSASISGTAEVGQTLTATYTPGVEGETVTYKWYLIDVSDSSETEIEGATESTYKLVYADKNKKIKVVVTGSGDYCGTKEFVLSDTVVNPYTYNVDWKSKVYGKAKAASKIVIGNKTTYASAVSSLTPVACGETTNDDVYAYYDETSKNLYVLADEKIVFEDNDGPNPFYECSNATTITLENIDTSKMTDMRNMFYGCTNVTSLDLSAFDTSNVTKTYGMFHDCKNLTSLNVSSFNTSKVNDMNFMFYRCEKLESLDVTNFDTSNVSDMTSMFDMMKSLKTIDLSNFDTSNVTKMNHMFSEADSLESLDLSSFTATSIEYMSSMFYMCDKLKVIDLSNFDLSSHSDDSVDATDMFYYSPELTTIYVSAGADWSSKIPDYLGEFMFEGCEKLAGGSGTEYANWAVGPERARVDGGAGTPGYFTVNPIGEYNKTNFLLSRFDKVKDVQWDKNAKTNSYVSDPKNCFSDFTKESTPDSWWTPGSYIILELNEGTVYAGTFLGNKDRNKLVPTYKVTLYTSEGADKGEHVLSEKVRVLGISNKGFMILSSGGWGSFIYTNTGWTESNNGTTDIYVDYDYAYPTLAEIQAAIQNY